MSAATACWKQSTQQSWKKCEHSFLFPWMPPTWYEKTSQELLSCRNRRSRTEKHLQLLFYSSGGTESVRGGVFPYKNIRPLTKSIPASLQKVLTVISWPKSSGSAGVSWSSVFLWVFFFFFWSQSSLINRAVSDLDFHNNTPPAFHINWTFKLKIKLEIRKRKIKMGTITNAIFYFIFCYFIVHAGNLWPSHFFSFERYSAFTLKHKRHTYRRCRCCLWWLLSYFFHISSLAHKIEFKVPVAYSWLQPPPAVASLSSRKTSVCIRINVRKKGSRKTFLSW